MPYLVFIPPEELRVEMRASVVAQHLGSKTPHWEVYPISMENGVPVLGERVQLEVSDKTESIRVRRSELKGADGTVLHTVEEIAKDELAIDEEVVR